MKRTIVFIVYGICWLMVCVTLHPVSVRSHLLRTAHCFIAHCSGGGSSGGFSVVVPKTAPSVVIVVARVAFIVRIPPFSSLLVIGHLLLDIEYSLAIWRRSNVRCQMINPQCQWNETSRRISPGRSVVISLNTYTSLPWRDATLINGIFFPQRVKSYWCSVFIFRFSWNWFYSCRAQM